MINETNLFSFDPRIYKGSGQQDTPPERRHMQACIIMAAAAAAHCSRVPASRLRVISATVPVASVVTVP